jgi:hypothetical protein
LLLLYLQLLLNKVTWLEHWTITNFNGMAHVVLILLHTR